ncbi:MAG: HAD family phosphatase [Thermomicrobiales bacterium]
MVDSEPVQFAAWDAFVARYDRQLSDDMKIRMYGTRLVDSARMVAKELALPITAEQVAVERDGLFFEQIPGNILAKPGAVELLAWLQERSILTALATSGHKAYVDLACESAGIPRRFDVEVTGDLVRHGKPHPETFLTASARLGVPPAEVLVLEDSPQGVRAAVDSGAICFAVPDNPSQRPADLSLAHAIVGSLGTFWTRPMTTGWSSRTHPRDR